MVMPKKGYHLLLTCSSTNKNLNVPNEIRKFLNELPDEIGMNKIEEPSVIYWDDSDVLDKGVSGVVMIAESHISIHTFPKRSFFWMDVFSCKPFSKNKIISILKKKYNINILKMKMVRR